jgi:hypothetical protein
MDARQERREEMKGRKTYVRMMTLGVLSVAKVLLTNMGEVRRLRLTSPSEERYDRPPRRYELPEYRVGMRTCQLGQRYLRPTRYCNPGARAVIALAQELGANRVSDREFAEAAFHHAKERMTLEIGPIVSVEENLARGTGSCFELISVFIALCRAASIRARYKIFATDMIQSWQDATVDADPLVKKWYDALGYFPLEGEGEAYIDGEWMVAHVGPTAERQAAAGIPVTRFGEDSLGVWFHARPGTIMRLESLPRGLATGTRLLHRISPASMERVNISVQKQIARGRQIIADAGGLEAYDEQARRHGPSP